MATTEKMVVVAVNASRLGSSSSVNSVDTISPPTMAEPSPLYSSLPAPLPIASGIIPSTLVIVSGLVDPNWLIEVEFVAAA